MLTTDRMNKIAHYLVKYYLIEKNNIKESVDYFCKTILGINLTDNEINIIYHKIRHYH